MLLTCPLLVLMLLPAGSALAIEPVKLREDALTLEILINEKYAYLERLPKDAYGLTPTLRAEAEAVKTPRELIRYSERALSLLADHHAITGASLKDSWAVFPSYGDLWIEPRGTDFVIEQVRRGSPAEQAGIRAGDRLVAIEKVPTAAAVATFWADLGASGGGERDGYAARVLAAGRRDRQRALTVQRGSERPRSLVLPNLYERDLADRPPLSADEQGGALLIRLNDSLGSNALIDAFDRAMTDAPPGQPIVLDLTDTPGGGNTMVARAILGWFVKKPTFYQMHSLPEEKRKTGIARQWVEQVLPRAGKHHPGPVTVRVGRWTGSMGEGLAIAFDSIGARVVGSRMAGLLGAIYDHRLPHSDLVIKLPTERLYAVDGTPREDFVAKGVTRTGQ